MVESSESRRAYSGPSPALRPVLRSLLFGVSAIPLFLVNLQLAELPAQFGHDASWRRVYAHFFTERFQAGVDYAFPMGPYGYFLAPQYISDLYWLNFAIQIALGVAVACSFVALTARAKTLPGGVAVYGFALFILPFSGHSAYFFASLITMTMVVLAPFRGRWMALSLIQGVIAFIALIKFGQFIVAGVCIAALAVAVALQERWWRGALVLLQYVAWLAALWLAAGQRLVHFPAYVRSALDVGEAYNQTMAIAGPGWEIAAAGTVAIFLGAAWGISLWRGARSLEVLIKPALFFIVLALLWKAGFLRQPGHARQFFAMGTLAALCVDWSGVSHGSQRRFVTSACVLAFTISVGALVFASRISPYSPSDVPAEWGRLVLSKTQSLLHPLEERRRLDRGTRFLVSRYDLPKVREAVGDSTIDMLAHTQGVLLVNGLNYHPRFVFQGYQAGTSRLARRNAEHLSDPEAPEFLLGWITPIDQRYPTIEDSEVLKAIFWNYEPYLHEEPYDLLRRRTSASSPVEPRDLEAPLLRDVEFGEWIDTSAGADTWQLLTLDLERSLLGALREVLFRPSFVFMETRMSDGEVTRWRIHRTMVDGGFILNPFLLTGAEMLAAYEGSATRWVTSFRVVTADADERFFRPVIGTELRTVAPLTEGPVLKSAAD